MEAKINIYRVITGGVIGGLAMLAIMFFIHAMLLQEQYLLLKELGAIRQQSNLSGELLHHMAVIMSGIPLAFIYVLVRDKVGAGAGTAIRVGILAWMLCLPGIITLYAFYNAGTFVPIVTAGGALAASIVGTLIAGSIYKD